jgi:hypothetical protein
MPHALACMFGKKMYAVNAGFKARKQSGAESYAGSLLLASCSCAAPAGTVRSDKRIRKRMLSGASSKRRASRPGLDLKAHRSAAIAASSGLMKHEGPVLFLSGQSAYQGNNGNEGASDEPEFSTLMHNTLLAQSLRRRCNSVSAVSAEEA